MKAQTNPIYRVSCLWIAAAACSAAQATWIVTNLHPAGATSSRAFAVDGNHQVGDAQFGSSRRATLWSGTAASSVDLHPGGATHSTAFAVYGGQQGGSTYSWPSERATLWSSSAASAVDMHPAYSSSNNSVILGMGAGEQVGFADVGIRSHAALWTGTAASAVDLHPSDGVWSAAHGVWGGQQVGHYARISDGLHQASLWSGTAASLVVLNPAGSQNARAFGIQGGEQVGFAQLGGNEHAALWRGSASSFVDLHIAGKSYSWATGVYGGRQVASRRIIRAGKQRFGTERPPRTSTFTPCFPATSHGPRRRESTGIPPELGSQAGREAEAATRRQSSGTSRSRAGHVRRSRTWSPDSPSAQTSEGAPRIGFCPCPPGTIPKDPPSRARAEFSAGDEPSRDLDQGAWSPLPVATGP
ncbi:MAG: hypothetical protein UZ18_ATM001001938 [Armatimonadetes bacterium OLB18]|nr:MAG: hypothetical protein UZ18_ATM001001938 [Armatimonadetes bacterium OLB18]